MATLPVSIDRIKKALTAPEPTGPPIRKEIAEDELPRFVVQTEAPRTLTLRSYLDDGTAVPGYVRPAFDPYHYRVSRDDDAGRRTRAAGSSPAIRAHARR